MRKWISRRNAWLGIFCLLIGATVIADEEALVQFELEDHAGTKYSNTELAGRTIIVFSSSREGTKFNQSYVWTAPIVSATSESGVVFVSVADLRGVPRLARGFVRQMFEPPQDDPVGLTLLDWAGLISESYNLSEDAYHLLAFDKAHSLAYQISLKEFDPDQLTEVLMKLQDAIGAE